jgi:NAD(P)H-hydrate repair Nnr-like enzyme with NAD(P)H-hydrate dehydratase domain
MESHPKFHNETGCRWCALAAASSSALVRVGTQGEAMILARIHQEGTVNKTATQPTSKQMPNEAIWFLAAAIGLGMAFGASWFAIVAGIVMLIMVAVIHLADIAPMESGPT